VLGAYRAAHESLSAESVKAIWPRANTPALSKAFSQIATQNMEFYECGIAFNAAGAEATCAGAVTFVPKVGARAALVESRSWSFYLIKQNDRWVIDRVITR
jgi:uncharacterized RmlC-like cupin family protein